MEVGVELANGVEWHGALQADEIVDLQDWSQSRDGGPRRVIREDLK